nr:DUF1566 domain-containing protein [Bacteroidota bacterium]
MEKARLIFTLFIIITCYSLTAQVSINTDGSDADASAMLDVKSNTSGVLIPRMTQTQREAISNPATGLLVFQLDPVPCFFYNAGTPGTPVWIQLSSTLQTQIADVDGDTKVQVEKNADEDHIRFDVGGYEAMTIDTAGRIGIGTLKPDTSAILELKSTAKGFLPPRMTLAEIYAITNPSEGLIVYNTEMQLPVFYDGIIWRKFDGTEMLEVGDYYFGGVIFYLDSSGHGLVCAVTNQQYNGDLTLEWGCEGTAISGADSTGIGTGAQNTIDILEDCTTPGIAAYVCDTLTLNGYSDWFLPSKDELHEILLNEDSIEATSIANGGDYLCPINYWSSSEYSANMAWYWDDNYGSMEPIGYKFEGFCVRAIRAF